MLLKNKNAVIYGAGGSLGGAVAQALAAAGARLFLTGRHAASVQKVADAIVAAGGHAEVEVVDAMDEQAIAAHLDKVVQVAGTVDVSFNATGMNVVQNIPLIEVSPDDFINPVTEMLRTRFLTGIAAGKVMLKQGSGVILSLTATPGGIGYPYTAGFSAACCAIESFACNLAAELGIYGVRVLNIRSGGSPDSAVFKQAISQFPEVMTPVLTKMKADTMLKRLPLMEDIANVAVFLSSEQARMLTGITIDVTGGTTVALNHRMEKPTAEESVSKMNSLAR